MIRASLKSLLGRKVRLLLSTFAIVLGVAFVAGTLVFSDTLNRSFTALFASTVGDVVVQPVGAQTQQGAPSSRTLPGSLLDDLRDVEGVARVDGNVNATGVYVVGSDDKLVGGLGPPSIGSNWTNAPSPGGVGLEIVEGEEPQGVREVLLDERTAERAGYGVGDTVQLLLPRGTARFEAELVGLVGYPEGGSLNGATLTLWDTPSAQELFQDGEDVYNDVWVTAEDGVSQEELRDAVAEELPDDVEAVTGDRAADDAADELLEAIGFITTFLLVFAGIAVVVGAFIIVNTFSILVAQRSRELALLRALGASRRQVTWSVQLEAFVLGVLGSTIGLGLGVLLAMALRLRAVRPGPLRAAARVRAAHRRGGVRRRSAGDHGGGVLPLPQGRPDRTGPGAQRRHRPARDVDPPPGADRGRAGGGRPGLTRHGVAARRPPPAGPRRRRRARRPAGGGVGESLHQPAAAEAGRRGLPPGVRDRRHPGRPELAAQPAPHRGHRLGADDRARTRGDDGRHRRLGEGLDGRGDRGRVRRRLRRLQRVQRGVQQRHRRRDGGRRGCRRGGAAQVPVPPRRRRGRVRVGDRRSGRRVARSRSGRRVAGHDRRDRARAGVLCRRARARHWRLGHGGGPGGGGDLEGGRGHRGHPHPHGAGHHDGDVRRGRLRARRQRPHRLRGARRHRRAAAPRRGRGRPPGRHRARPGGVRRGTAGLDRPVPAHHLRAPGLRPDHRPARDRQHPGPVGDRADPGGRAAARGRAQQATAAADDPAGVGGHLPARRGAGRHHGRGVRRADHLCTARRGSRDHPGAGPPARGVLRARPVFGVLAALLPARRAARLDVLKAIATD